MGLKIGIFGAGALGSLIGAYLSKDHDVTLYSRKAHAEAITDKGLLVAGINGRQAVREHNFRQLLE